MNYNMLLNHIFNGITLNFFYHNKFNRDWSDTLSHLLDMVDEGNARVIDPDDSFDGIDYCLDILFDDLVYSVWVANKPFAYAHLFRINGVYVDKSSQFRPSIWAMMRLSELVDNIKDENKVKDLIVDFKELNKKIKGVPQWCSLTCYQGGESVIFSGVLCKAIRGVGNEPYIEN